MQQVAEEDELFGSGFVNRLGQPLQGLGGGGFGHRHPQASERDGLAEVRVGYQQAAQGRQEDRALRQQTQAHIADLYLQFIPPTVTAPVKRPLSGA